MTAVTTAALGYSPLVQGVTVSIEEGKATLELDSKSSSNERKEGLDKLVAELSVKGFESSVLPEEPGELPTRRPGKTAAVPWWCDAVSAVSGLLASSCCLLQLAVNFLSTLDVIHLGCVGFNQVLGPLRPFTRVLTLCWLVILWSWKLRTKKRGHYAPLLIRTLGTICLAWLPELLLLAGGPALAPPTNDVVALALKIDGMGCEACQLHVNSILATSGGVVSGGVIDLEAGLANIMVARSWNFDLEGMSRRLSSAGYDSELLVVGDES